ncbi:hypothetical protein DOTSEDRAFT_74679 [Dothistroma septosporum NZE10]|uniref:Uncharacterized protein n=1 Tax=Dothistroma septosporum (strain NZE10 / CBS 128990) TaxID=675120 RepID=N1PCB2_DOTSN|nr:hypothetical protein DOTSEDRAFT_74679 [Dothistroma septosporum NZE10]
MPYPTLHFSVIAGAKYWLKPAVPFMFFQERAALHARRLQDHATVVSTIARCHPGSTNRLPDHHEGTHDLSAGGKLPRPYVAGAGAGATVTGWDMPRRVSDMGGTQPILPVAFDESEEILGLACERLVQVLSCTVHKRRRPNFIGHCGPDDCPSVASPTRCVAALCAPKA